MRGSQLPVLPDRAPPQWLKEEVFVTLSSAPETGSQPVSEAPGRVWGEAGESLRGVGEFTWGSTRLAVRWWAAAGTGPVQWGGCGDWRTWRLLRKERQSRRSRSTVDREAGSGGRGQLHICICCKMRGCIHVCGMWIWSVKHKIKTWQHTYVLLCVWFSNWIQQHFVCRDKHQLISLRCVSLRENQTLRPRTQPTVTVS